jgi:hypothetical protein
MLLARVRSSLWHRLPSDYHRSSLRERSLLTEIKFLVCRLRLRYPVVFARSHDVGEFNVSDGGELETRRRHGGITLHRDSIHRSLRSRQLPSPLPNEESDCVDEKVSEDVGRKIPPEEIQASNDCASKTSDHAMPNPSYSDVDSSSR